MLLWVHPFKGTSILLSFFQVVSKQPTYEKPNFVQIFHFLLKNTKTYLLKTKKFDPFSTKYLERFFSYNWNDNFFSGEIISKVSGNSCSVSFERDTTHLVTPLTGMICKIKFPVATVGPPHYRVFDSNTVINWLVQTYHRVKTEPINCHY